MKDMRTGVLNKCTVASCNTLNAMMRNEKLRDGVYAWAQYYRRYPNKLAEEWGLKLKPFQEYILIQMFRNNFTAFFASRGLGKTWLVAVFCLLKCVLYPGSKIIISSFVLSQGMKVVVEKIPEILKDCPLVKREICDYSTTINTQNPHVCFYNDSWIRVVPANENARSGRANVLIMDEFRMIKKPIYDSVLRRFLTVSRQCGYTDKPEYKEYPLERNQQIFLTSAYYKFNWSYDKYKTFRAQMLKGNKYFLCALPYQMAIKSKLSNKDEVLDELRESDFNAISFDMEMRTLFYGQAENSFFDFEEIDKLRTLAPPIYPVDYYSLIDDKKFRKEPKADGEIRFLSCDIATMAGKVNDASSFILFRLTPDNKGYIRKIPFLYSIEGGHTLIQSLAIRRLFDDLECDYVVLDRQNAGIGIYDQLILPMYDKERGVEYEPWLSMNDKEMQARGQYPDSKEVIFTINASEAFNDEIARSLKDTISRNRIEFLENRDGMQEFFDRFPAYYKLEADTKDKFENVYTETENMINEMILLEKTFGSGSSENIKLKTVGRNRKDRYTALAYGNYFAKHLEQLFFKPKGDNDILKAMRLMNSGGNSSGYASNLRKKIFR